jgi:hypothetical protein
MRTTQDYEVPPTYESDAPQGVGWVTFAAIMLGFAGTWNFIEGIAAIGNAHVYTANAHYVFSDLKTWGWIIMLLGIAQLGAAFALFAGSEFARWFGIAVASLNAIGQLMFIPAYPFWGILMFTLDILIIYGLTAYGGHKLKDAL